MQREFGSASMGNPTPSDKKLQCEYDYADKKIESGFHCINSL
jgi:hypothetical protein